MAGARRDPPVRRGSQPSTTPANGAAANGSNGVAQAAAPKERKKPGPKRPWSVRLAEQEARMQKIKDEGRRESINSHGKDDLTTQKIWTKLRLVNKTAAILREMGLSDEHCIAANTELEEALNARLAALKEDPSIAVPIPKKNTSKGETAAAAADDGHDADADGDEEASGAGLGPFP